MSEKETLMTRPRLIELLGQEELQINERPLLGFLAANPSEIRAFRRGVLASIVAALGMVKVVDMITRIRSQTVLSNHGKE